MEKPQVKSMVRREMEKNRIGVADLASRLKIKYSSAYILLGNKTLQVDRLYDLSVALEYNFFREIAQLLPLKNPDYTIVQDEGENALLKERVKLLEIENGILRQTLKDMAGR